MKALVLVDPDDIIAMGERKIDDFLALPELILANDPALGRDDIEALLSLINGEAEYPGRAERLMRTKVTLNAAMDKFDRMKESAAEAEFLKPIR